MDKIKAYGLAAVDFVVAFVSAHPKTASVTIVVLAILNLFR